MKKIFFLLLLIPFVFGCEGLKQEGSHFISSAFGLEREVTLYNSTGGVIKTWSGKFQVETDGTIARFMYKGKAIIISGTYLIEEK